jgi:hypothetical protein
MFAPRGSLKPGIMLPTRSASRLRAIEARSCTKTCIYRRRLLIELLLTTPLRNNNVKNFDFRDEATKAIKTALGLVVEWRVNLLVQVL